MTVDWGGIIGDVAPSLIKLGTGLVMNNQAVKNAQGQANAQQEALNAQYAIALQNEKNILAMQQKAKAPVKKEQNNLPLYIGLGVGGVLVLGVVIFAVTRK
jgi:hypothetical protein